MRASPADLCFADLRFCKDPEAGPTVDPLDVSTPTPAPIESVPAATAPINVATAHPPASFPLASEAVTLPMPSAMLAPINVRPKTNCIRMIPSANCRAAFSPPDAIPALERLTAMRSRTATQNSPPMSNRHPKIPNAQTKATFTRTALPFWNPLLARRPPSREPEAPEHARHCVA